MLMIENYLSESIWNIFMKNEYIIKGLKLLEINTKRNNIKITKQ